MIKMIKVTGIVIFLVLCSIQDIREKRLSVKRLAVAGILFLIVSLVFEEIPVEKRLCNLLPGMAAFLLAALTKEQIGYGDAASLEFWFLPGRYSGRLWGDCFCSVFSASYCWRGKRRTEKQRCRFFRFYRQACYGRWF